MHLLNASNYAILITVIIIPVLSVEVTNESKALWSDLIDATKEWSYRIGSDYARDFNSLAQNKY